jgi:hypothetical protein
LVLLTPVLLVLVLLVVQTALWWHAAHLADAAAARAAVVTASLDGSAGSGVEAAESFAGAAGARLTRPPVVTRSGEEASATVEVAVPHVVPGFPTRVRRSSVAPVERFVPEGDR